MEFFVNELSLEGQFHSDQTFAEAVKTFVGIFSVINEKIKEKNYLRIACLLIAPLLKTNISRPALTALKIGIFRKLLNALFLIN